MFFCIFSHSDNSSLNRLTNPMEELQQQQQQNSCQWNVVNTPQPPSMATVSNGQSSDSISNNNSFNLSTYGFQQNSYQPPCAGSLTTNPKKSSTMNRSMSMISNNFAKNDVNSSISLDSITPSITNDHMQQSMVMSAPEVTHNQPTMETFAPSSSSTPFSKPAVTSSFDIITTTNSLIPSNVNQQKPVQPRDMKNLLPMTSTPEKQAALRTAPLEDDAHATGRKPVSSIGTPSSFEPPSTCTDCSMIFTTGIDLKKHIDLVHQGRQGCKKYQCAICAVEFDEKTELKDHLEKHALEKPFKCDICGVRFANQAGQKRHKLRLHETKVKTHSCDKCGKQFFDKHDLKRHVKVHTRECPKCGKKLGNKDTQPHSCEGNLAKKNTEEDADSELKCAICGVVTSNKISWGYHMWKHTKDPKYINLPVDKDATKPSFTNNKDAVSNNIGAKEALKTGDPTREVTKDCNEEAIVSKGNSRQVMNDVINSRDKGSSSKCSSLIEKKTRLSSNSIIEKVQPNPPDAHATSHSHKCTCFSQPLCLQTSVRKPLQPEREIQPLNMQMTNS